MAITIADFKHTLAAAEASNVIDGTATFAEDTAGDLDTGAKLNINGVTQYDTLSILSTSDFRLGTDGELEYNDATEGWTQIGTWDGGDGSNLQITFSNAFGVTVTETIASDLIQALTFSTNSTTGTIVDDRPLEFIFTAAGGGAYAGVTSNVSIEHSAGVDKIIYSADALNTGNAGANAADFTPAADDILLVLADQTVAGNAIDMTGDFEFVNIDASDYNADITFTLSDGAVNVKGGIKNDTFSATNAQLDTVMDGGVGIDTLTLTDAASVAAGFGTVTNVEKLTLANAANGVVLAASDSINEITGNADVDTIDASARTVATAGEGEYDLKISTAAGDDIVTLSQGKDDVSLGDDDDTLIIKQATDLTKEDIVDAGEGGTETNGDTVDLDDSIATITDGQFEGLSNFENLTGGTGLKDLEIGDDASAAGLLDIDVSESANTNNYDHDSDAGTAAVDVVVDLSGMTSNAAVTVSNDGANDNDMLVQTKANDLTSADTLTADADGSSTLEITTAGSVSDDDGDFDNVTGFTTLNITAQSGDVTVKINDNDFTTIDSSSSTGDNSIDTTAETADLTINTGSGNDTVNTGDGNVVIDAGNGNNSITLTGTAGKTSDITTGTGDDTIALNAGDDVLDLGSGTNNVSVAYANWDATDTIAGSGGENILTLSDATTDDGQGANQIEAKFNANDAIDKIVLGANTGQVVTLGTAASAAGLTTIDASAILSTNDISALGLDAALSVDYLDNASLLVDATAMDLDNTGSPLDFTVVGSAGDDVVKMTSLDLTSGVSLQLGADTTDDILEITTGANGTDGAAIVDADFTLSSGLEKLIFSADADQSITLGDEAKEAGIVSIDASAVTTATNTVTVDLSSAATDTNFTELTLGAGDDSITMKGSHLTSSDTIVGGDGLDTITFSSKVNLADTAFTDVTEVEKLVLSAGENQSIEIGAQAKEAGIGEIDGSSAGSTTVDLSSASDMALNVTLGSGNDTVTMGSSAYSIDLGNGDNLVKTASAYLTSGDNIAGGTGTDTLEITDAATIIDEDFDQISAFETLHLADGANTLTLGSHAKTAGVTTIDASAATTGNDLSVTVEDTGFDIEGGAGDDTLTTDSTTLASTTFDGGAADTVNKIVLTDEAAITNASFANIRNVQTLELDDFDADQSVVLGDASTIASNAVNSRLNTIDGSNLTGARAVTVDVSGMTTDMTIHTEAGDDVITLGRGTDTVLAGAGDDIIKVSSSNLTLADDINGEGHTGANGIAGDILDITDGTNAITDAMFTEVSNIETLHLSKSGDTYNVTLGTEAIAAGITEVTIADGVIANIDLSGAASAIKVIKDGAANVKVTTEDTNQANDYVFGSGDDTVEVKSANFTTADSYDFGTGSNDTIEITDAATVIDADFTGVSNLDILKTADAANSITLGDNAQNSGLSKVDLSAGTTATDTQAVNISSMTNNMELDIDGSAGIDTYTMKAEHLTSVDDLDGGGTSSDKLVFSTMAVSKADADFAGVSNIEELTLGASTAAQTQSLTLGTNALGSFEKVDATNADGVVQVTLGVADDIEIATDGTGTLEITMDAAHLTSADTFTGGTTSDDKLSFNTLATSVDASAFGSVTNIETLELANTTATAQSVTLDGDFTTVDASTAGAAVTIDAATQDVNLAKVTTNAGDDLLKINVDHLASTDEFDLGGGTDTLQIIDDAGDSSDAAADKITDDDFENIDNVETLKLGNFDGQEIALGNKSALAGITNVDISSVAASQSTIVDLSGMTTEGINHTITGGAGDDTVKIKADHLETGDSIVGSTGTDEIIVTTAADLADADFTNVTDVEKVTLSDTSSNQILSLGEQALEEGIDTVVASATGSVSITLADTTSQHDMTITTGAGNDTITMKAEDLSNADSITAAGGTDELVLSANGANTTITAGAFENVSGVEKLTLQESGSYTQSVALDGDIVTVDASAATAAVTIDADEKGINLGTVTTGTGADTVKIKSADFVGDSDTFDFGTGTDTLELTTNANGLANSDFTNVDGLEILKLSDFGGQSIVIGDNALDQGLTTVDLTGVTTNTNTTTVDMSAVTLLKDVTINGGAGADTIKMKTEHLTSGDNLDGNGGSDILELTTVATNLTNAEFANVSEIETLKLTDGTGNQKLTLGDNAISATKITNITAAGVDDNVEIDLDSVTTDVSLNITGGDGDDKLSMKAGHLSSLDTIDLGAGTNTLSLSASSNATITSSVLGNVSNIDQLDLTSTGVTYDVELITGLTTVDASAADGVITIDAATNTIDLATLTTGSANDILKIKDAQFTSTDTFAFGGGTGDTIQIMDAATIIDNDFTNVTGLEKVQLGNFDSQSVTLSDKAVTAGVTTVDASAITNTTYDLTVSLETITDDSTTKVTTGAGDDSITMKGTHLTSADLLNGGTGTDTLTFSTSAALDDSDFTQVSGIENLVLKDASGNSLELGDNALASFTNSISVETVSAADNDVAIDMSSATSDADVNITTIGGDDTITMKGDHLTSADTLTAAGGSDTLAISDAATLTSTDFTNVTGIEKLELQATTGAQNVVMASGFTTLDASVATDAVTVDASSYAVDLDVTTGTGADTIKVDSANFDGSDTIDGGTGTDTLHIINADASSDITDTQIAQLTGIEKIKITDSSAAVDINFDGVASTKGINTIDMSTTASVNTIDLAGMTTGVTVDGGSGSDIITIGSADADVTINAGSGDDTVTIDASDLDSGDNVDGGLGTDTLILSGTISATTSMANVSGFESIQLADGNQEIILGADGDTNNILTIDASNIGGGNSVTVDITDYTDVADGGADDDAFVYTGGAGTDTFKIQSDHLSTDDTLDGGAGTDTLEFTDVAINNTSSLIFNNVSNFEKLKLADVAADQVVNIKQGTFSEVTAAGNSSTNAITIDAGNVTSNITLDTAGGNDTIIASKGNNDIDASAGDDTIKFNVDNFDSSDAVVGGDGTDTIEFIDVKTVIADDDLAGVDTVENIVLKQDEAGQSVELGDDADTAGIVSVTTTDVSYDVTIDAGTGFDNNLTVTTGAGDDTVTLGGGADTASTGAGDDTIKVAANKITSADTIDGEGDNDTLELTGAATSLADSAFTNVSNVETLKLADETTQSLTLGTNADGAGIKTIDTSALADNKTVSLDLSGFDVDTTITGGQGDETVTVTASTLDANDSIDLGSVGTDADKIIFADALSGGSANPTLSGVSGVETLQLADGASQELTLVDTINTDLTIDATNLVDTNGVTVDGSALGSSTTKLTVNTSAGVDTIKLGSSTNVVNAGGRDDSIEISAANLGDANTDTINGGDGTDTLTLNEEGTVADASLANITNIENVVLTDVDGTYDITLGTNANTNSIVKVDGDALTTGTVSVDASGLGAKDVEFKGGDANDTFTIAGAQLNSNDTIDGKSTSDTDTLIIKDGATTTIADAAFTNVTNIEKLQYADDEAHNLTIGAEFVESGIKSVDASALTSSNALTVDASSLASDSDVSIIGGAGDDVVKMDATHFTSTDLLTLGDGDNTLQLSGTATGGDAIVDADFNASGSGIDKLAFTENYAQEITIGTNAVASGLAEIDATALTSANATVDVSSVTGSFSVKTGSGTDTITLGDGNITVAAGASDDTIKIDGTKLNSSDTINGEAGTDILEITTKDDLVDSDFTNITNMETLKLSDDTGSQDLTLSDEFDESGITKVDASALTGTNALTVDLSAMTADGAYTIIGGAADDTVEMDGDHLTLSDKVELGGGDDTILIKSDADSTTVINDADFTGVTGTETLKFTTYNNTVNFGDAMKTAGVTTIDASANTNLAYGITVDMTSMSTANTTAMGDYTLLGGSGDDYFKMRADQITSGDTITGGGNGSLTGDTLEFTTSVVFADASKFGSVSQIDVIKLNDLSGQQLVLADNLTSVVDASSLGALNGVTVDGSALGTDIEINTGAGNDIIKVGSGDDKGAFLAGDDKLTMAAAELDSNDEFDFGAGTDELILTGAATLTDSDFTNIKGLETLTLDNQANSLTLGDEAKAAGLTKIDNSAATTNNATIDMSSMSSNIGLNLLGASGVETIKMQGLQFDSDDTIDGGVGTDVLYLTDKSYVTDAAFENVTNVETLKLADGTHKITLGAKAETAGITTIDTSEVTNALTIDISGTSGNIDVTGRAGADVVVIGQGDNAIDTGAEADIIKTTSANLTSADTIEGGSESDTLVLTTAISESTDSKLTNVTGVETLELANAANQEVTLHANNDFTKVDASNLGGTNDVKVNATALTNDLEVVTKGGDDIIVAGDTASLKYTIDSGRGDDLLQFTDAAAITSANDVIDGGDGTDTLEFTSTSTASTIADSFFGNHIDNVETIKFGDVTGSSLTYGLNAQNQTGVRTIDTSAVGTGKTTTIDLAAAGVAMEVVGGAGTDVITIGSNNDTVTLGAGDDTLNVTVSSDRLNENDTIDGGDGTDVLTIANTLTMDDDVFENITNMETLNLYGTATKTITIGDNAETSGIDTINADTTDGSTLSTANVIVNGLDFANNIDIITGNGADTITLGSGDVSITSKGGNDTIKLEGKLFDTSDSIDAGAGDDVVQFTDAVDLTDAMLGKISNVEVIKFSDKSNQTVVAGTAAMTNTLYEYDATAITSANSITMDFTNVGSNQALVVKGGGGNDEFIFNIGEFDTSDTLIAGAGTDTLTFADQITTGASFDALFADTNKKNSIDVLKLSNTGTQTFKLGNDARLAGIDSVDATNLTEISKVDIDAYDFTVNLEVTSNGGNDEIIAGTGADKFILGVGDDSVTYRSNFLTVADTLQGGIGNDTIYISNLASLNDAAFTNISGFEKLVLSNTAGVTNLTLSSNAEDSGLVEIDGSAMVGDSNIDLSDMNIDFTIDTGAGSDTISVGGAIVDVHAGNGEDIIEIQASQLHSTDILSGGNQDDILQLTTASTGSGVSLVDADFTNISSIETLKLANFNGQQVVIGELAKSAGLTTIDATVLSGANGVEIDATSLNTSVFTINAGGGNDIIKLGTATDTVDGNGGNDTIIIKNADFTIDDNIDGDGGNDTIEISDAATVVDADFTNVTNVETLKLNDFASQSVTLGEQASTNSLDILDASLSTHAVTINAADVTSNMTLIGGQNADTISVTSENLGDTDLHVNGGTGDDNLVIVDGAIKTGDNPNGLVDVDVQFFESVEKITLSDYDDQFLTLGVQATEMGLKEIDASALTGSNQVDLDLYNLNTDVKVTGGAGDDIVTIRMGYTDSNDTIDLGDGTDTLIIGDAVNTANSGGDDFETWLESGNGQYLSNIETIKLSNRANQELVLGDDAKALGLTDIDLTDVTSSVTVDASSFDSAMVLNGTAGGHTITTATTAHNDTIVVKAGNDTINLGAGDDNVQVGVGNDTVKISSANLDSNDTIYGDDGNDTLIVTGIDSQALTDAQFANIDKFETLELVDANGQVVTLGVNAKNSDITEVDASALGAANGLTLDISAFTGDIEVTGGAGADIFTGGQGDDTVNLGAEDDTIKYSSDYLNSFDRINGGDGTDTLIITDTANLVDAQFTNLTSVEVLKISQDVAGQTIQLGAEAVGAGIRTLDLTDIAGENYTVDTSSFNQSLEILVNRPGGTFTTSNNDDVIQIESTHLTQQMTYDGANGTDTIRITANQSNVAGVVDADFTKMVGVEVVDLRDGGDLVIGETAVLAGVTTVDLSNSTHESDVDATAFNRALHVELGAQVDKVSTHTVNTINDTVYTDNAYLGATDEINLGAGTSDAIVINDAANLSSTELTSNITNVEVLKVGSTGNHSVDFTSNGSSIEKIDGTAMTGTQTSDINVTGKTESIEVRMGSGDDTIKMSFADLEKFSDGTLDYDDDNDAGTADVERALAQEFINAGGGNDTLMITTAGDITDAHFDDPTQSFLGMLKFIGFETLGSTVGGNITIGDHAAAEGIRTVDVRQASGDATIETGAIEATVSVYLGGNDDSVSTGAGNDVLYIASDDLTSADNIELGNNTGAGDKIVITTAANLTAADFTNVVNVEELELLSDDAGQSVVLTDTHFDTFDARFVNNGGDVTVDVTGTTAGDITANTDIYLGAGDDSVKMQVADMAAVSKIINGGAGNDTIELTDSATLTDSDFTSNLITAFETIELKGSLTVDSNFFGTGISNIVASDALTYNGSSLLRATTVTGSAGNDDITTGNLNDTVTGVAGNDTIDTGSGNDRFIFAGTDLDGSDSVDGGAGTDTIEFTTGVGTFANADYGVSNVEYIEFADAASQDFEFGAAAVGAGLERVDASDLGAANGFTLTKSGVTNATNTLTFYGGAGNDKVVLTDENLEATDIYDGNNGTDNLEITATGNPATVLADAQFTRVQEFETLTLNSATNTLTLAAEFLGSGITTINAATSTGVNSIDMSAVGVIKAYNITGGGDVDTITMQSNVFNSGITIDGGAGTDVLKFSNRADIDDSAFASISNLETLELSSSGGVFELGDDANTAAIATIDGSAAATQNVLVDMTAMASDMDISIIGGDIIDVFEMKIDHLTTNDTIEGNNGVDILKISGSGTALADADFTNLSELETLYFENGATYTAVMETEAQGTGITFIDARQINDGNLIDINASHTAYDSTDMSFQGSNGNDVIQTAGGDDEIRSNAGDDVITSGAGNDTLVGLTGDDKFIFTSGNFDENDRIEGGAGTDTIQITDADATFSSTDFTNKVGIEKLVIDQGATIEVDTNFQNSGIREIDGSASASNAVDIDASAATVSMTLIGGDQADVIRAGRNTDTLTGNGGNDKFVFNSDVRTNGANEITDFTAGDKIAISFTAGTSDAIGNVRQDTGGDVNTGDNLSVSDFNNFIQEITTLGSDTLVTLHGGDTISLLGITGITETDFVYQIG